VNGKRHLLRGGLTTEVIILSCTITVSENHALVQKINELLSQCFAFWDLLTSLLAERLIFFFNRLPVFLMVEC
jgi:hypothetical protein